MERNLKAGIPSEHMKLIEFENIKGHNASWDFVKSEEGRCFVTLCCESEDVLPAILYEYFPDSGKLEKTCDISEHLILDTNQMAPSKIHTSIDFLPDGNIILATHNTAPAPNHKRWLYEQYYEHIWEGYPGSHILIINPDSKEVKNLGIPIARESIYGGLLGHDPRYYFFCGYMRGHLYRLDLQTLEVKDYGKVTEFSTFRLIKDLKGRIYGSSMNGQIWRYDPEKDEVEGLHIFFNSPYKEKRELCYAIMAPNGNLFFISNADGDTLEINPETLEYKNHGTVNLRPQQPRSEASMKIHTIGGLTADENFVLYYGLDSCENDTNLMRLVRWDILQGKEPENLGLIVYDKKISFYISEMIMDNQGILHLVDVIGPNSPFILAVDVNQLSEPSLDAEAATFEPVITYNIHVNADKVFFKHIEAEGINTIALSRMMPWNTSNIIHMQKSQQGDINCIAGEKDIYYFRINYSGQEPKNYTKMISGEYAVSCLDMGKDTIAVLTSKNKIIMIDCHTLTCYKTYQLPNKIDYAKVQLSLNEQLLLSTKLGEVYLLNLNNGELEIVEGMKLFSKDAIVIRISEDEILFSGYGDTLQIFNLFTKELNTLDIRVPSIRGRAFIATLTTGIKRKDGSIVCGSEDGLLFVINNKMDGIINYGRLYSTGSLRDFVQGPNNSIIGIYGSEKDAGHIIAFSDDRGLIDLGRPKIWKEDTQILANLDIEISSIHYISKVVFNEEKEQLFVASGERYGCIMCYEKVGI